MKIIYDIGANNGSDLSYYLEKSDLVVAVEANPLLCDEIQLKFSKEISQGRLIVENFVVTVDKSKNDVPFYIHKTVHVQSQFPRPPDNELAQFELTHLPSKNIIDIINSHGTPHYIKIDIERYDKYILKAIFDNNIYPAYLSSESHDIEVFCLLVALGRYQSFKIVDGDTIPDLYSCVKIKTASGEINYAFPHHSAGPFGNDIAGQWYTAQNFFQILANTGLGWKDIHVSNVDFPG